MSDEPPIKYAPDRIRRLEARVAQVEDKVEVLEHRRTTWVPSRSFANLSGRQRELVLLLVFLALTEIVPWVMRRWLAPAD